ncbi:MAG: hypothetical protein Q8P20_03015 [bacterium]|nr:hypothetical protein [bacterium]
MTTTEAILGTIIFSCCALIYWFITRDYIKDIAFNATLWLYENKKSTFSHIVCYNPYTVSLMKKQVNKELLKLEERGIVKKEGEDFILGDEALKALFVTLLFRTSPRLVSPYFFANKFHMYIKDVEDILAELAKDSFVFKEGRWYGVGENPQKMLL